MPLGAAKAALFGAAGGVGLIDGAYWFGGYFSAYNTIVFTRFDTDATSTLSATLSDATDALGAFGNGQTAAYIAGNDWGTPVWGTDLIGKLTFASESYEVITATLSQITWGDAGASNSGTAGYFAGGQTRSGASSVLTDAIQKLLFADDSCSEIGPTLSQPVYYCAGAANSGTAAYWFGGSITGGGTDRIDKTVFTDDTTADSGSDLSQDAQYLVASANSGTAAYCQLGYTGSGYSKKINKLLFSDDSVSDLGEELTTAVGSAGSAAQKGSHAYIAGGNTGAGRIDVLEKLTFASDTSAVIIPTIPVATSDFAGASCDAGMV